jgi:hypothetical protein
MDTFFGIPARLIQRKLWMVGVLGAACVVMIFALEGVTWQTVLVAFLLIVVLRIELVVGLFWIHVFSAMGIPQARWNRTVIAGLGSRG